MQSLTAFVSRKSPNMPENCDRMDITCWTIPIVDRTDPVNSEAGTFKYSSSKEVESWAWVTEDKIKNKNKVFFSSDFMFFVLFSYSFFKLFGFQEVGEWDLGGIFDLKIGDMWIRKRVWIGAWISGEAAINRGGEDSSSGVHNRGKLEEGHNSQYGCGCGCINYMVFTSFLQQLSLKFYYTFARDDHYFTLIKYIP